MVKPNPYGISTLILSVAAVETQIETLRKSLLDLESAAMAIESTELAEHARALWGVTWADKIAVIRKAREESCASILIDRFGNGTAWQFGKFFELADQ